MNKITRTLFALIFVALLIAVPRAQLPAATTGQSSEDRIALYQALLDLTNPWTVMCVAAHPDDEDGTSLIVMRRRYGAHTVSLFSTFGEGGQNAIGPELYEELGAIRARETMAAAEVQGSEPYFLGLKDFGYSKSADEAFKFWGHDEALRRMVLEIRKLRPDVIITNHSVLNNDHGHHQATARLVVEAFDAAADPTRFPEQLKDGITTWQVQRLFVRVRGNQAAQNPDRQGGGEKVVTIDPNERDPVRGVVYAEEALRALQKHATQGPWPKTFAEFTARFRAFSGQNAAPGQLPLIRYALVREAKDAQQLSKESHNFLDGLRLPENIAKQLESPTINGHPLTDFVDDRERILDGLIETTRRYASEEIRNPSVPVADPHRREILRRLRLSLAVASGLTATLATVRNLLVPGQAKQFELVLSNSGPRAVRVQWAHSFPSSNKDTLMLPAARDAGSTLAPGTTVKVMLPYKVPANEGVTVPHSNHLYDNRFAGKEIEAAALVELDNVGFGVIPHAFVDVVPYVEIDDVTPSSVVLTPDTINRAHHFQLRLINHTSAAANPTLTVSRADGSEDASGPILKTIPILLGAGEQKTLSFELATHEFSSTLSAKPGSHKLVLTVPPLASRTSNSEVGFFIEVPVVDAEGHVALGLHVGYVRGFDFSLPNALNALGVESKELSVNEVKAADLSKYASIIVDNRVYESQPELIAANQKLFDYAKAGGNLIVFYHKSDEWNPDARRNRPQLAPYKLILGNERITDENAPVTFLEPEHPLLNVPNKLNQDDFKDWIQERGLYYPKEWDPQFHALLQSNDPGEAPLKGGLLVADYGRGHYIYTSMVWYRQLRAGVPGAYRMLANMISYGHAGK